MIPHMNSHSLLKETYGSFTKLIPLILTATVILLLTVTGTQDDSRIFVLFAMLIPVYLTCGLYTGPAEFALLLLCLALEIFLG